MLLTISSITRFLMIPKLQLDYLNKVYKQQAVRYGLFAKGLAGYGSHLAQIEGVTMSLLPPFASPCRAFGATSTSACGCVGGSAGGHELSGRVCVCLGVLIFFTSIFLPTLYLQTVWFCVLIPCYR
jgi:hypothetical protein